MLQKRAKFSFLLIILSFPSSSYSQEKEKEEKEDNLPKALLTAPVEKEVGRMVVVKSEGSVGINLKFDVMPKNDFWYVVKFQDDSIGVILVPETPGKYYVHLSATNAIGKLATAFVEINIKSSSVPTPVPPQPSPQPSPSPNPPSPDLNGPLAKALLAALNQDLINVKPEVINEQKKILQSIYQEGIKAASDQNYTRPQQVYDYLRTLSLKQLPKTALLNLRQAIADQEKVILKLSASTPLSNDVRQAISAYFHNVVSILDNIVLIKAAPNKVNK